MTPLLSLCILNASLAAKPSLPAQCDPKDSKNCVQPLMEGESAPFSGQLMTFRRAAHLAVQAGQCSERVDIAVNETKELMSIDLNLQKALRENDAKAWAVQKDLLLDRINVLTAEAERHWYEHPALWAVIGAAVTTGVFYGAIKTVNHATK